MTRIFSEKVIPYHCKIHKVVASISDLVFPSGTVNDYVSISVFVNDNPVIEDFRLTAESPTYLGSSTVVLYPNDKVKVQYTVDDTATWTDIDVRLICGKRV